jgi:glycosyltransferase involved in cell wall biosynthesis
MASLLKLRRQLDLDHRVEFAGRLDEAGLLRHLSECRAVVFPPFNEDYGFVTVEAFSCHKPVMTCRDSGGPAELVRDGESGWVTDANPTALALAMRRAIDDKTLTMRMGEAGARRVAQMTWSDVLGKLLL